MARLRISKQGMPDSFNKVAAIKAVRLLTGIGLKEAKDTVEEAMTGVIVEIDDSSAIQRELTTANTHEAIENLRAQGMELQNGTTKIEFILQAVKESAKLATDEKETDLAILLLGVISQHEANVFAKEEQYKLMQEENRIRAHAERMRREEADALREKQEERFQADRQRQYNESYDPEGGTL